MCSSKWICFLRSCRAHGQFLLCFACVCLFVCVFVCFHFSCILQCACYFFNCPCCVVLISISVAKRLVFCVFHVNTVGSGCGGNGDGDGGIYVELLFSFCCCMLYSTTFTHQKKIFAHIWIFHHGSSVFESHSIIFMWIFVWNVKFVMIF